MTDAMAITDFHTHAFPDSIAERAIRTLEAETDRVKARLDGRLASLVASMDRAGISRSVLCSIATKPEQFPSILDWSRKIASARIVPFPSIHPRDPDGAARVRLVVGAGFRGVKFHPYYQAFDLDDESLFPLYDAIQAAGLIMVCHTGFDIAFPRIRRADPAKVLKVMGIFPRLKLAATHLGAWDDWDEVRRLLLGRPVYMEISYSLEMLSAAAARELLLAHPAEYLLFGTDSPWQDQSEALKLVRGLRLGEGRERALLCDNARRLLDGRA